jgi:hypothetical protein
MKQNKYPMMVSTRKTPNKRTREEKKTSKSKQKTTLDNAQWGALRGEITKP